MTPKILIVDDEEINHLALEAYLAGDGYELHFASDGTAACERARTLHPDLILLDVMMPGMDGFSVCRLIRADPIIGRIPIILLTALNDDASRLEGLETGADEFITKPCRRAELRARVRTIVLLDRCRSIAEQRARFERLHELAPLGIVMADANGRVLNANPSADSMLAPAPAGRLAGMSLPACFDASGAAAVQTRIDEVLAGRVPEPCEVRTHAAAPARIMQLRAASAPEGDGQVAWLIFDDVTAEAQARAALKELNGRLETMVLARTAQLTEANTLLMSYASFLSHDLRSPLTVVKGYLAMLSEGVAPMGPEAGPMVQQALAAATLMEESVRNILQLASDEHAGHTATPVTAVDPTPVVSRLIDHLQLCSAREAKTHFVLRALPPVEASPVVLERVFYNLLLNAVKYSSVREAPCVEVGANDDGSGPVFFVRDNGVGFDPAEHDKLFREFSRLATATGADGLGLGLSFVARLVRVHGGQIWADSQPGRGATFYLKFPRRQGPGTSQPALDRQK